jgi:hypothetical protein
MSDDVLHAALASLASDFVQRGNVMVRHYVPADEIETDDPLPLPDGRAVMITCQYVDADLLDAGDTRACTA